MSATSPAPQPLVLINLFTVAPENQTELVSLLSKATSQTIRHVPGFEGSTLHRSLDGTKVAMYARWRSLAEYQAMRASPTASPYLDQALALARFEPGMYEVVEVFAPSV